MKALVVVQARMGSTRLPGKVLADLAGRPLLAFLLERLAALPWKRVVATSELDRDDAVAAAAAEAGVAVVRGPEEDVLTRFAMAIDAYEPDLVVRLTADCPLSDPALVRAAVEQQRTAGADYVSNTVVRTFPDGLDVEVVRASVLRQAALEATDGFEREHVTPFVYRHPERFSHEVLRNDVDLSAERWTVDTAEDLEFVRSVVDRLGSSSFGWRDVLAIAPPPD
ncbi:MAG: spore coat polysaccharide biosynthesis protein SpsF [Actinomycetota bacterium]